MMKKYIKLFISSCLLIIEAGSAGAQIMSVMGNFSPSTSTLIGEASRIGYDNGAWSTYYMRYNDSSYFCGHHSYVYWTSIAPAVNSTKVTMPQDFVITDFKKFIGDPGYIGSYQGKGMYGFSFGYNQYNSNGFQIIKLPAVDKLTRTTEIHPSGQYAVNGMKFFSIGEKLDTRYSILQSYILEYYLMGTGMYKYAPLQYNPQSYEQEIADDVITAGEYVIFATRDTRLNHAPVNLRISDTNNVLSNTSDIAFQWRFQLPDTEQVYSELRLLDLLDNKEFILAYTIYNTGDNNYYLCIHRINLLDFLAGNNGIVSHEIKINKECSDLIDMIFKPNLKTMVVLLSGEGKSELYHMKPYSDTNDYTTRLDYSDGSFYSIDTIGENGFPNEALYIAMGDSVIFTQNFSNLSSLSQSCLPRQRKRMILRKNPVIKHIKDPLAFYSGNQEFFSNAPIDVYYHGTRTCNIINEN